MPTLISKTVDTGATEDYDSMNAAEAANFGCSSADMTAVDEYSKTSCICTDGNTDTTAVQVNGQTCDSTRYYDISVPQAYRADGVYPSSGNFYRLEAAGHTLDDRVGFGRYTGLAIKISPNGNNQRAIFIVNKANGYLTISKCIVTAASIGAYSSILGINWSGNTVNQEIYCSNNIIYGFSGTTGLGINGAGDTHTSYAYNNTVVGNTEGIKSSSANRLVAKNSIAFDNSVNDYTGTFNAASTHNGYTNGQSGPTGGSNAIDLGSSGTAIFTDYSNDDFHLLGKSSPAYRVGTDLSGDSNLAITDDIDGDSRHASTPCIGADEYVFATSGGGIVMAYPSKRFGAHGYFVAGIG